MPPLSDAGRKCLAAFNGAWSERAHAFRCWAPPPWWGPNLILDAHLRAAYEFNLPIGLWCRQFREVLHATLGDGAASPLSLQMATIPWPSLPDLWRDLPVHLAGRVTLDEGTLFPLACALASPPRFGTAAGRYPEQRRIVGDWLEAYASTGRNASQRRRSLRALDIGCGTGQGTYELANWLIDAGMSVEAAAQQRPFIDLEIHGITREPLEVWMAANRALPHLDPITARRFAYPKALGESPPNPATVTFMAGSLLALPCPDDTFDLVLCNGLLGGPALDQPAELALAWSELQRVIRRGGLLIVGQTFHEGRRLAVNRARAAAPSGFAHVTLASSANTAGGEHGSVAWRRLD